MSELSSSSDLTPEEFTLRAIERLRKPPYKCIHSVYSGFNKAFREYFPRLDPIEVTQQLAKEGKIVIMIIRGGALLCKPEDAPPPRDVEKALRKILEGLPRDKHLTPEEFVIRAIERLRRPQDKCVHSVFLGLMTHLESISASHSLTRLKSPSNSP
jgi:hypothetical protein